MHAGSLQFQQIIQILLQWRLVSHRINLPVRSRACSAAFHACRLILVAVRQRGEKGIVVNHFLCVPILARSRESGSLAESLFHGSRILYFLLQLTHLVKVTAIRHDLRCFARRCQIRHTLDRVGICECRAWQFSIVLCVCLNFCLSSVEHSKIKGVMRLPTGCK